MEPAMPAQRSRSSLRSVVQGKVEDAALVARRRTQIIDAAIVLFGKRGFHGTTVHAIAQRAGLSTGLVYQYFGDKEDVLFLALLTVLDSYKERIPPAIESASNPLERFRAAVHAYCSVIDANVEGTVLAYRETKSLPKARRNIIKQREIETNALVAAHIRDCVGAGVFEETDVELLTYQIIMFAHAWALKAWHFRGTMRVAEFADRNLALLLDPLLTAHGRRQRALLGRQSLDARKKPRDAAA